MALRIKFMVAGNWLVAGIKADPKGAIDDAALGWDRVDQCVRGIDGDRQRDGLAAQALPFDQIAAAGAGGVVVGFAGRGVAPHPAQIEPACPAPVEGRSYRRSSCPHHR